MLKTRVSPLFILASCLLLFSCKQPETVVVTESPTSSKTTEPQEDTSLQESSFKQLNIGEYGGIPTLSPLFAENTSTMRALQLVFEGLVQYNEKEMIVPALARNWTVSSDSLTYRFVLRNNVYYHDSDVFNSGIGRRFMAEDVKFVFERMTRIDVPDHAARLFMNIRGFEPYFREQHNVLLPSNRQLEHISGITVSGDSVVTFKLEKKDSDFLEKLASPYALIYPREAVTPGDPSAFRPVGTGPFTFSRKQGDNHYIFSKYNNYYRQNEPVLNRVDVIIESDPAIMTEMLQEGSVHLIPQTGPGLLNNVTGEQARLKDPFASRFSLNFTGGRTYHTLYHNSSGSLERKAAEAVVSRVDSASFLQQSMKDVLEFRSFVDQATSASLSGIDTVNVAFTSDPYMRQFLRTLSDSLQQENVALNMLPIRTPVRNTGLYSNTKVPLYPGDQWPESPEALVGFSARQAVLSLDSIENLPFNRFPWWINLRNTILPGIDNLGR